MSKTYTVTFTETELNILKKALPLLERIISAEPTSKTSKKSAAPVEKKTKKAPVECPDKAVGKWTVKELKAYIQENGLELPEEGTGKNNSVVRADYLNLVKGHMAGEETSSSKKSKKTSAKVEKKKVPPKAKAPAKKGAASKKPKVLEVVFDDDSGQWVDDEDHVYYKEGDNAYIIGALTKKGDVRALRVAEARKLEGDKIKLWHTHSDGLDRAVNKPTTKKEITSLLKKMEEDSTLDISTLDDEESLGLVSSDDEEDDDEGEEDGEEDEDGDSEKEEDVVEEVDSTIGSTLDDEKVSEEDFKSYVKTQNDLKGKDKANVDKIAESSGLSKSTVATIILEFDSLKLEYPSVQTQTKKVRRKLMKKK